MICSSDYFQMKEINTQKLLVEVNAQYVTINTTNLLKINFITNNFTLSKSDSKTICQTSNCILS